MTGSARDSIDRRAVRRNARRLLLVVAGMAVITLLGSVLAGVILGGGEHSGPTHRHSPLALLLAVGVPLLALGLCCLLLRLMMRRSSFQALLQFGWSERRAAYKAVKAGRPLSDREVRVARASLAHLEGTPWARWILPGAAVLLALESLDHHGFGRWVWLAFAAAYAVLWPFATRASRRTILRYRDALSRGQSSAPMNSS